MQWGLCVQTNSPTVYVGELIRKNALNTQFTAINPDMGTVIISQSGMDATDIVKNSPTEAPLSTTNSSSRML